MKRSFTLVELLIVIIIIWILLAIWVKFLSTQIQRNLYILEKEKLITFFKQTTSENFGKIFINWKSYDYIIISLENWKDQIIKYLSWKNNKIQYDKLIFKRWLISWLNINGNNINSWSLIYKSYNENIIFKTNSNIYNSWTLKFWFYFDKNYNQCLQIFLENSKITKC